MNQAKQRLINSGVPISDTADFSNVATQGATLQLATLCRWFACLMLDVWKSMGGIGLELLVNGWVAGAAQHGVATRLPTRNRGLPFKTTSQQEGVLSFRDLAPPNFGPGLAVFQAPRHHLFPSMPRSKYPALKPILQKFAEVNHVPGAAPHPVGGGLLGGSLGGFPPKKATIRWCTCASEGASAWLVAGP